MAHVLGDVAKLVLVRLELDEAGEPAGDRLKAGERRIAATCSAVSHWPAPARGHIATNRAVSGMAFVGGP